MNADGVEVGVDGLLAAAAGSLHQQAQVEDALREVVLAARDTVPGVDQASISVAYRIGGFGTVAATASVVYELDQLQYQLDEGPCLDALQREWQALTNNLAGDVRWPRYAPAAARRGVQSQLGVRLFVEANVVSLNLYSGSVGVFGVDAIHLAQLFGAQAVNVLTRAVGDHRLIDALSTRKVIGHAVGIVMERHRLGERQALAFLIRASRTSGIAFTDVAGQIVDDVEKRAV